VVNYPGWRAQARGGACHLSGVHRVATLSAGMGEAELSLLDRWCVGDATAGNTLFKRHFESVYRFFEHKTDGDVDDLVQETFLQCVKSRETFRRQSTFRTFLFAIARHVLLQHWRKQATTRVVLDFDDVSIAALTTSVGTRLARSADRAQLLAVLRALPLDQQLLLELYYWEDFDRDQLAEVFEVETATIGSRLFRARQALADGMSQTSDDLDGWARSLAKDAPS
jgi:RNA polymerase sigma factor (sigma-70 family)